MSLLENTIGLSANMGRVGSKKKMKLVRKKLREFIASKALRTDYGDYYKKCELEKLLSIGKYNRVIPDHEFVSDIIEQITKGKLFDREMPDIQGSMFGLEHTEVSPFYRHKRKGDSYRVYHRIMRESKRALDFENFSFEYLDMPSFFKKLGVIQRSQFKENIIQAVQEKSKKFLKYERFEHNGLWIDFPYNISFPDSNLLGYFLQNEIFSALKSSPFDFFIFGNPDHVLVLSKDMLEKASAEIKPCQQFYLTDPFDLTTSGFKVKKGGKAKISASMTKKMPFVAEDIAMPHIFNAQICMLDEKEQPMVPSLYFDDLPVTVKSLQVVGGNYIIAFSYNDIDGQLLTDFQEKIGFAFSNVPFEAGEELSLHVSQHDAKDKQKLLTGTKRLILDYGNKIDIFMTPPVSMAQKGSEIKVYKTGDLT